MLKLIPSSFILKKIALYTKENKKLELFKYNKEFKVKLGINIINYRELSGKYIITEKNGLTKEYNDYDYTLIFKGKYLKDKRNGQRKEFNNIGEYLNGKRNGRGIEYDRDGNIIFEGVYFNGKNGMEKNMKNMVIYYTN